MKIIGLLSCLLLSACAVTAPKYNTSFENIAPLRNENLRKVSIGKIEPDSSVKSEKIEGQFLRATPLLSPYGSFSNYLRESLTQELTDARIYDAKSSIKIDGYIMNNDVSVPFDTGHADLEVRVIISEGDKIIFNKIKSGSVSWPSSFFGGPAVEGALQNYPLVYQKFLQSLFSDIDFLNALKIKGSKK